jgi:RND family efflux transporter MFP subunit
VTEGSVLFTIDDRPYKAYLDQAVAEVAQSQAQLARAEADFVRARNTFNRDAISRSEYDLASAAFAEAKAAVGIAEAKRDQAKLNWTWTKVTAPISGQISRRMVDPGNLVQADVTPLTTIVATQQVYVNFDIDERTLLRLRRLVSEGKIPTRDEHRLKVHAALADETDFPHEGYVDFSDNRVDPGTGTLRLRGVFENPALSTVAANRFVRRMMSPGLFARVRLPVGMPHRAVMVPEKALGSDQGQKYVYVIASDKVDPKRDEVTGLAVRHDVVLGSLHGNLRVIESGLEHDERVIVSGVQRVRNNKPVVGRSVQAWQQEIDAKASAAKSKAAATAPVAKAQGSEERS